MLLLDKMEVVAKILTQGEGLVAMDRMVVAAGGIDSDGDEAYLIWVLGDFDEDSYREIMVFAKHGGLEMVIEDE